MLTVKLNKKETIRIPERKEELTVDQAQQIIKFFNENDEDDWLKLFSILSGLPTTGISESKSEALEIALYKTVRFLYEQKLDWQALPMPKTLFIDNRVIEIPKNIGRLSIGQAIQARKSIEGMQDLREGISIVTAIYLQPLVDGKPFDHVEAIRLEQEILKMPMIKIFPIGFFLLRRLNNDGNSPMIDLNQVSQIVRNALAKLRNWLRSQGLLHSLILA